MGNEALKWNGLNKCRGKKNDEEEKKCQIFASVMYSIYQADVSPEGGLEVRQTLWFARKLIYSGAKWRLTICILLKSNNFHTAPMQRRFHK